MCNIHMYKLGNYDAYTTAVCRHIYKWQSTCELYSMGIENIYGRNICHGISGKLPAEFYGVGAGKSQSYTGMFKEAYIVDTAYIHITIDFSK